MWEQEKSSNYFPEKETVSQIRQRAFWHPCLSKDLPTQKKLAGSWESKQNRSMNICFDRRVRYNITKL